MTSRFSFKAPLFSALLVLGAAGCFAAGEDDVDNNSSRELSSVQTIQRRPDGLFDVWCTDGRYEVATQGEVLANTVCATPGGSSSGFPPPIDASAPSDASAPPHHGDGGVHVPHDASAPPPHAGDASTHSHSDGGF